MISTKVFSLSAGTGACHAPVFAGRGKGMIVVSGKDLSFRKAHYRGFSLLKSISDGVVFCHLIFQGKLYFRVYHISKRRRQKSARRTRSHRIKFCVLWGLGGAALNKQFVANG